MSQSAIIIDLDEARCRRRGPVPVEHLIPAAPPVVAWGPVWGVVPLWPIV